MDLLSFLYLFLRLSPFILVCFFVLTSVFNQDFRGIIYLAGLLISCFLSISAGNFFEPSTTPNDMCTTLTFGIMQINSLPISLTILCFTFFYILIPIVVPNEKFGGNTLISQNIPTIIFFVLLIVADLAWNIVHSCFSSMALLAAIIISGGWGVAWAYIIRSSGNASWSYFNTAAYGNPICNAPAKQRFVCKNVAGPP